MESKRFCFRCHRTIENHEPSVACSQCGRTYHAACWNAYGRCASQDCNYRQAVSQNAAPNYSRIQQPQYQGVNPQGPQGKKDVNYIFIIYIFLGILVVALALLAYVILSGNAKDTAPESSGYTQGEQTSNPPTDDRATHNDQPAPQGTTVSEVDVSSQEKKYQEALDYMQKGQYATAYTMLVDLNGYSNSNQKIDQCISKWVRTVLDNGDSTQARNFYMDVSMNNSQVETVYGLIHDHLYAQSHYSVWRRGSNAQAVTYLLKSLPQSFRDTRTLVTLMNIFSSSAVDEPRSFVEDNEDTLRACFGIPFVKKYLTEDDHINGILVGEWKSSNGKQIFKHYRMKYYDGVNTEHHGLPTPEKPENMDHRDIENLVMLWEDSKDRHLCEIFHLSFTDYDTLQIYCCANQKTYTLYRQK